MNPPLATARRSRLVSFVLISGTGWLIDMTIMAGLVASGITPLVANCTSAGIAVTYVFIVAQRRTFIHDGDFIVGKFALYVLFNALAILAASTAIAALSAAIVDIAASALSNGPVVLGASLSPTVTASIVAKIMITPLTLYANFLFMGWLLEGRASLR